MASPDILLRASLIWLLIAGAEVIQGILRLRFLNPRTGDHRARQIGVITGCIVIFNLTWLMLPWIGARTRPELLAVGILWTALMLSFDVILGRFVFKMPWTRIAADFDPRRGNLLGLGMLFILASPLLAAMARS